MGFAPIRVNFPDSSRVFRDKPEEQGYIESVVRVTRGELEARARDDTARSMILLQAPDESTWALTVADDGTLKTVKVPKRAV